MIGKTLGERYEIIEQVGEGGMARVYKAKCKLLNRYVAVKVLKDEFANDEEFVKKFRRESQAAASLSHPNILNVHDVGTDEIDGKKVHYIVMELIEGETLKDYIKRKGSLDQEEAIDFSIQIAEALKNAHDNQIIHRDIKPQNIMVTKDNRIKVTDFGIARAATSSTMTATSSALGSVHYFSPEQARGGYTDEKSDIYSLGIVMYEMLTGHPPYDGETPIAVALKHLQEEMTSPSEKNPSIPPSLENIILKCTKKQQADRYRSAEEVILDLKKFAKGDNLSQDTLNMEEYKTQIIPDINEEDIDEDKKEKGRWKLTLGAIILAFLVATAGFIGFMKLKELFAIKDEIEVPNFVGMILEDAEKLAEEKKLNLRVKKYVVDDKYEAGEIVKQSIDEGSKVKEGYTIDLVVAEEEELKKVPSVVNKSLKEAEQILITEGFEVGEITYENSEATPKDHILKQEPEAFTNLEKGSRVNLIVSKGRSIELVVVPNLTGKNIVDAKNILIDLGLKVNTREEYSNDFQKDEVMWQSHKTGSELEKGSTIDLSVSIGPRETEATDPVENEDKEGPLNINLTPYTDREETEIKIVRYQDGYSTEVYRKTHSGSEGEFTITVRGKKGSEFEVFFDDVYQFTRVKDN